MTSREIVLEEIRRLLDTTVPEAEWKALMLGKFDDLKPDPKPNRAIYDEDGPVCGDREGW